MENKKRKHYFIMAEYLPVSSPLQYPKLLWERTVGPFKSHYAAEKARKTEYEKAKGTNIEVAWSCFSTVKDL